MSAPVCRCCGSTDVMLRGRKRGQFIRRDFEFYACRQCELVFVEPFSGFAIYNDAYYRGAGPDPYVDYETEYRNWRTTDRLLEFADLTRIAEEFVIRNNSLGATGTPRSDRASALDPLVVPPSGGIRLQAPTILPPEGGTTNLRWLDFGCGAGGLLKFLRARGQLASRPLELTGHDVGSYAELLGRDDGFRILDLDALRREPDGGYDVITMVEVIEHLPQPADALALVARLLKPGGLLLLTTGNLGSPIARLLGLRYHYCCPEIHVSLFNPRCLSRLYARCGLESAHVRYRGSVQFKVVKTLRHRPVLGRLARTALQFPGVVQLVDALYGVSAMPCAIKPSND
jgi:2-polyprenyl-3-methyl-5-hydroxy-6-metoxy-1,4-benzoquinol methylase